MAIIKTESLSFFYPRQNSAALYDISLTVMSGEFVVLCGRSGCGKSTLLRHMKPELAPHGEKRGAVYFNDTPIDRLDGREACRIGFVMQNADEQIVTDKVWHELAFGLENLGMPAVEIRARVAETSAFFGIESWFHKRTSDLSGGQKQLLSLASVMVMQPDILLLDEPTGQLDPIAAERFLRTLSKINRELGTTVILAEHRLDAAVPLADRVIVMDGGRITADGTPQRAGRTLYDTHDMMLSAMPAPMRVYFALGGGDDAPVTIREGRDMLECRSVDRTISFTDPPLPDADTTVTLTDVWFRYEKNTPDILKGLSLTIRRGETYAILGGNGAGKTTALSVIASLIRPYRGRASLSGRTAMLPQAPLGLFTKKTIGLDLDAVSDNKENKNRIIELCGLGDLLDRHPYDLSGGEIERAALAKVLLREPDILLLDEPTKGLDAEYKKTLADILYRLKQSGITIIMVSHDIEFCARYADRCGMLFDGMVASESRPREFFGGKSFYTTAANRMARGIIPGAVLYEDIIEACGAKYDDTPRGIENAPKGAEKKPQTEKRVMDFTVPAPSKKLSRRTKLAAALSVFLIPLTIFFGAYYLGDRKYYFISLLIILEALLPFAIVFEGRKPKARELVLISALCALTALSRSIFYMVPQIKPALAMVIICGAALGGESGFLIGAGGAFLSNFAFGQGPWTPWQIFAFGLVGLSAGMVFKNGSPKRLPLCIFGAFAALLYGGIMNPASVIISSSPPTIGAILSAYALGLPFDLLHALSTVVFLWLLEVPMTEKLVHVREKYGLI